MENFGSFLFPAEGWPGWGEDTVSWRLRLDRGVALPGLPISKTARYCFLVTCSRKTLALNGENTVVSTAASSNFLPDHSLHFSVLHLVFRVKILNINVNPLRIDDSRDPEYCLRGFGHFPTSVRSRQCSSIMFDCNRPSPARPR